MTLDEKLQLLTGADAFSTASVDRLNVGKMEMHDLPFGVRVIKNQQHTQQNSDTVFLNTEKNTEYVSTAFMTGCAMGASFDREIIAKIGAAIGAQCRAYNISAILGPSMNIIRQPLCGRNFEYFSEDPVLSGELAAAYVSGVQSSSVAACPKHFIANNQERGRYHISSEIDERTMREIYLRPFEIMVKKSNPWSIMTAYNRINGIYASECRRLLRDVLRDEWGFDGAVISDWGGCKNRAYSLIAGLDIAMPYAPEHFDTLKKAYENGLINDIQIDESVRHILNMHEKTANQPAVGVAFEEHHLLTYDSACSSMTLLKNQNKALPIDTKTVKNLLIIGTPAKEPLIGGDGSSKIKNRKLQVQVGHPHNKICSG